MKKVKRVKKNLTWKTKEALTGERASTVEEASTAQEGSTAPETLTTSEFFTPPMLEMATHIIYLTSHFLTAVLSSAAFRCYIKFLVKLGLMETPLDSEQKEYCNFTDSQEILFRVTHGNQTPVLLAARERTSWQEDDDPNVGLQQAANEKSSWEFFDKLHSDGDKDTKLVADKKALQEDQEGDGPQNDNNNNNDKEQDLRPLGVFTKDQLVGISDAIRQTTTKTDEDSIIVWPR